MNENRPTKLRSCLDCRILFSAVNGNTKRCPRCGAKREAILSKIGKARRNLTCKSYVPRKPSPLAALEWSPALGALGVPSPEEIELVKAQFRKHDVRRQEKESGGEREVVFCGQRVQIL